MPDVATAPTATAAQTAAVGSRLMGFYLGGGGVKVDCLFDTASFLTRDAAGRVTVNGANANYIFNVAADNPSRGIVADIANNAAAGLNGAMLSFTQNTINNWCIGQAPGVDAFAIYVGRNGASDGAEVLRLNSAGNVGIGTTAITAIFGKTLQIGDGSQNATVSVVGTSGAGYMATAGANLILSGRGGMGLQLGANDSTALTINTSGNVGIGTTTPGAKFHVKTGTGQFATFESTNARGTGNSYFGISDATGRKSFFGYGGGTDDLHVMNEVSGLLGFGTNAIFRWAVDASGHFYAWADNTYSMGKAGNRISVVFAATGAINTSDERHKVWIGRATEDRAAKDRRIARAILDELGWYQFTDAVTEKGPDGARWHYGARAQRIWQIVADEGLAPPLVDVEGVLLPDISWAGPVAPAWLCFDGWNDQFEDVYRDVVHVDEVQVGEEGTGEFGPDGAEIMRPVTEQVERIEREPTGERQLVRAAGHLFGFRVDEMNLLLSWALHDRLSALEAAA